MEKTFKLKRRLLHNLVMSYITDDIWNNWKLKTFATYKNNFKDEKPERIYRYTLTHGWNGQETYNLWLKFGSNSRSVKIIWCKGEVSEKVLAVKETSLQLDSMTYSSLDMFLWDTLTSEEKKKMDRKMGMWKGVKNVWGIIKQRSQSL